MLYLGTRAIDGGTVDVGIQDDLKRLEIRNERLHRLRLLELAQARQGNQTPPDIIIEIESTKAELGMSDLLLAEKASNEFADAIGPNGQFLVLTRLIGQLAQQGSERSDRHQESMDALREQIETRLETQGRAIEERIDRVEEHQDVTNATQDAQRIAGQRRTRLAMFAIAVALLLLASGTIFIIGTLKAHGL
jgi:hypothetical protein